MRDTVELLEAIGRDATLRRALPGDLARALEAADASDGLVQMAASGDDTKLVKELGLEQMHVEHHSQTVGHEEEEQDDDLGETNDDKPSERPDDPLPT